MKRRYRVGIRVLLLVFVITISFILDGRAISIFNEVQDKLPIYRVNRDAKEVSLTFDINWAENDELPRILEVLDKYNVKATFFIMGGWVNYSEDNKNKLIMIKEGGHEIGNHSYIHPMFSNISESRMKEELDKTNKVIEEATGVTPNLFRFPSGDYNKKSLDYVKSQGFVPIQWDVDSLDWKEKGADEEYNRVMKKVKEGSILLFHNNAKYTPGNLDKIIKTLKEEGYEFLPVGEMMYQENYYINDKGEQIKK